MTRRLILALSLTLGGASLAALAAGPYTKIAEIPIGTVMSRLARGRKRLAGLLGLDAREAS